MPTTSTEPLIYTYRATTMNTGYAIIQHPTPEQTSTYQAQNSSALFEQLVGDPNTLWAQEETNLLEDTLEWDGASPYISSEAPIGVPRPREVLTWEIQRLTEQVRNLQDALNQIED